MRNNGTLSTPRLVELLGPWLGTSPAYRGIATGIRGLILDGRLPVGSRLPAERVFAEALKVSRVTVGAAYDVLRFEGYVSSAHGAGSWVTAPVNSFVRPDRETDDRCDIWDLSVAALPAPSALIDALTGATEDLHPLMASHGLHPMGLPQLRDAVATHLSRRGLATTSDQVLITNGALHGWHLLLQVLSQPGDRVLVEQPTYPAVLDAVAAHRRGTVALAVSAGGWESPATRTRLAHVTPDGQNPTGLVADGEQRRRLLRDIDSPVIVCDETFADLILDGPPREPLGSLDSRVITLGSMSKSFWAGLRIGWIRADRDVVAQLAQARAGIDLASPVLEQLVAHWFLRHAETVLEDRRALLRRSRDALTQALSREFPSWRYHVPAAGMFLWIELPENGATRLASHALDRGLRLTPGPRFTVDGTADRWFRLPFILSGEQVDEMVEVLADAATTSASGTKSSRSPFRWTA